MVENPILIQGGMGAAISTWEVANAVAKAGQEQNQRVLGIVSGVGIPQVLTDRIRAGEPNTLQVLTEFNPKIAQDLITEYSSSRLYRLPPKPEVLAPGSRVSEAIRKKAALIAILAAYVEVTLAKKGQNGPIGINLLERTQLVNIFTLLGAVMAKVDYVCMGAGNPWQVPGILDNFANGDPATYLVDIVGSKDTIGITLDPKNYVPEGTKLKRPRFLVIASQHILPMRMKKNADGFVLEGPMAGGHNAPTRDSIVAEDGQPIYNDRDAPKLDIMNDIKEQYGKPFWLAGGYASPKKLDEALSLGAAGVQIGTAFALCEESGMDPAIRRELLKSIREGDLNIITSLTASPSGMPFQVAQISGSLSDEAVFGQRIQICNLGHLVEAYKLPDGSGNIGFRCPAEPLADFKKKGGDPKRAVGKICLCNALASTSGHGLQTANGSEPAIVTLGKDTSFVKNLPDRFTAADVVSYMFSKW